MKAENRHQCLIYDGPPSKKLPLLASIIKHKMDEGYRCLYLNSPVMIAGMRSTLSAIGIDVTYELAKASLVLSAEPVTLGNTFDPGIMLGKLEDSLNQAMSDGYKGLWVTGDMSWEFGPQKDFSKLLEYEWGLEELFRKRSQLSGICQYHQESLPTEMMRQGLITHSNIVINDTLSKINPHYLRSKDAARADEKNTELDKMITALCEIREIDP